MNVFIGFGYNHNDQWIPELVFPLIESFDGSVATGENVEGQVISESVTQIIKNADAALFFLTPRNKMPDGNFSTHPWVRDEMATALAFGIPSVEIRERSVHVSEGIASDRQYIEFDHDKKAELLVKIAKVLCQWRQKLKARRFVLLPKDIVQDARPHISAGTLSCHYQYMNGSKQSPVSITRPFRFGQGLCIDVKDIPSESALIQITLKGPGFSWTSDYESIQMLNIHLQRD